MAVSLQVPKAVPTAPETHTGIGTAPHSGLLRVLASGMYPQGQDQAVCIVYCSHSTCV